LKQRFGFSKLPTKEEPLPYKLQYRNLLLKAKRAKKFCEQIYVKQDRGESNNGIGYKNVGCVISKSKFVAN
jgi:hypothetical protein